MAFFTYIHAKFLLKSEQNPKNAVNLPIKRGVFSINLTKLRSGTTNLR